MRLPGLLGGLGAQALLVLAGGHRGNPTVLSLTCCPIEDSCLSETYCPMETRMTHERIRRAGADRGRRAGRPRDRARARTPRHPSRCSSSGAPRRRAAAGDRRQHPLHGADPRRGGWRSEVRAGAIDASWLMLQCESLARAAGGRARSRSACPTRAAGRPPQPDRAGVRAAGPPRGRDAAPPPALAVRARAEFATEIVGVDNGPTACVPSCGTGGRGRAGRARPLPRRRRRCAQHRAPRSGHPHARPRAPRGRRTALFRAPLWDVARRASARHLQRHPSRCRRALFLPAGRGRPLAATACTGIRGRAGGRLRPRSGCCS